MNQQHAIYHGFIDGEAYSLQCVPFFFADKHAINDDWYLTIHIYQQMNPNLLGSTSTFLWTWTRVWPWPAMPQVTPLPKSDGGGQTARPPWVRPPPSPSLASRGLTLACTSVRPAHCMVLSLPRNLMSIYFSKVRPSKWCMVIDFFSRSPWV